MGLFDESLHPRSHGRFAVSGRMDVHVGHSRNLPRAEHPRDYVKRLTSMARARGDTERADSFLEAAAPHVDGGRRGQRAIHGAADRHFRFRRTDGPPLKSKAVADLGTAKRPVPPPGPQDRVRGTMDDILSRRPEQRTAAERDLLLERD